MLRVRVALRRGAFALRARFDLPTPGVAALFGRSGCGKSTLINLIAGLLEPDEGFIAIDERVLLDTSSGIRIAAEARRIGYVFQDARLFPHLRVAANLRYAERRAAGARYVGFDEVSALLALEPLLERRVHQLSGGEKQRVAIGRALLGQPRLLLLDEPLTSLDGARREEVLPYLERLRDQLAVPMVYVSHQFDEVLRLATHVVLMDAGATIAEGEIGPMSLRPELRRIVGADAVGAVIDGEVRRVEADGGLAAVQIGDGELRLRAAGLAPGMRLRVQILARDVIVATGDPQGLSVRNAVRGTVRAIAADVADACLITIDVGGAEILARVTADAVRELALAEGLPVVALVKTVSISADRLRRL
ncbi:MAG TPA: molybdenum ABC transporter ATP-binding protein [Steroidobacteraceae bacterium]|nr:molybdenum ABC transporter ATP-binding protein [Steroidobacteraceae bacterium]